MSIASPDLAAALDAAPIIFFTAVSSTGQPQTSPVWFIRDGEDIVVYNRPSSPRLASIAGNDQVALNLRGDRAGEGALSLEGRARLDDALPLCHLSAAYRAKYGPAMVEISGSEEAFGFEFGVGVRVEVTRVRAWGLDHVLAAEA